MIEVEVPGARVAFSTRQGGVSEGPYGSLNLGLQTDDDAASVIENRHLPPVTSTVPLGSSARGNVKTTLPTWRAWLT